MNTQHQKLTGQATFLADRYHDKETNSMHAPLLMLEIQANALKIERRDQQLRNDQLHLIQGQQSSRLSHALLAVRRRTGTALIGLGERLRPKQEPTVTAMNS